MRQKYHVGPYCASPGFGLKPDGCWGRIGQEQPVRLLYGQVRSYTETCPRLTAVNGLRSQWL
jgi:hypothetical protein